MNLSTLEQQVLMAVMALHPDAYGVSIGDHIRQRTGKEPSIGSIYAALDRLEEKGFAKPRLGEATDARGGKRKMHFTITASGQATLRESLRVISSLKRGLRLNEAVT
jgi:PadR family transcriptional regulator, regulatory protein PadR